MKMNTKTKIALKFAVSITYDVADFFIGRIPIFGTVFDAAGGILAVYLWGNYGLLQFLELADVTDQFDGFIPTVTIAGILSQGLKEKR